jgi:hypothetical protein
MDKEALVAAVELLARTRAHAALVAQINDIVAHWDERPMVFAGALACLNSLIDLALANKEAYARLLALAEEKRNELPDRRRAAYQRSFMRERRARLTKATQLEEIVRGRPLTKEERAVYWRGMMAQWMRQRDEFVQQQRAASWKERNAAGAKFWDSVDHALDKELSEAKRVLSGYRPRRTVRIEPTAPANPQMFLALKAAKDAARRKR